MRSDFSLNPFFVDSEISKFRKFDSRKIGFNDRYIHPKEQRAGGGAARLFFFFFPLFSRPPCERNWPPCKVVFFGLATNALNVRNNNNNNILFVSFLYGEYGLRFPAGWWLPVLTISLCEDSFIIEISRSLSNLAKWK